MRVIGRRVLTKSNLVLLYRTWLWIIWHTTYLETFLVFIKMDKIVIIDFGSYGIHVKETAENDKDCLISLGKEIRQALSKTGFCYFTNHGMDETLIKRFFEASLKLFEQPTERKESYEAGDEIGRYAWLGFDGERLNPERPPDLKETFSYCPAHEMLQVWPAEDSFETLTKTMYEVFTDLCYSYFLWSWSESWFLEKCACFNWSEKKPHSTKEPLLSANAGNLCSWEKSDQIRREHGLRHRNVSDPGRCWRAWCDDARGRIRTCYTHTRFRNSHCWLTPSEVDVWQSPCTRT